MPSSLSSLRALCAAVALLFVFAHPAAAQLSFKPTAESVQEDQLLKALKEGDKITGRISIPDAMASSLIQPAGRARRCFPPVVGPLSRGRAPRRLRPRVGRRRLSRPPSPPAPPRSHRWRK